MTRIGLFAATAFIALLPLTAQAEEPTVIGSLTGVKWIAAPPAAGLPNGTEVVALFGDPAKDGQYANRVRFPSGAIIPPHTHPNDENVTVLSGTLHVGLGTFRLDRWVPGSYIEASAFGGHVLGKSKIDRIRLLFLANLALCDVRWATP